MEKNDGCQAIFLTVGLVVKGVSLTETELLIFTVIYPS